MHADFKSFGVYIALIMLLVIILSGCTTVKYVPVIKEGERAKVPARLIEPAKRLKRRSARNTPLLEAGRQWTADRRLAGNEADRSDSLRAFVCAERGDVIKDHQGHNLCRAF